MHEAGLVVLIWQVWLVICTGLLEGHCSHI